MKNIFRIRSIDNILAGAKKDALEKTIGPLDLILIGVGATVGTGIFVLTGIAAADYAGPAISLSYLIAAVICIFTGLAYAELAALLPVSGSSYTYSYAIFGEFIAWLVACGLVLEYTVGASTVSAGWSGYFVGIVNSSGLFTIPEYLTKSPSEGGVVNLPAVFIAFFIGFLLYRGTKTSIMINRILVALKLVIIFCFVAVAAPHIQMEHYANFMPFGWHGVAVGAATIFYAYIGFDAVSTAAEEIKNPNRNLPIGIIGSLLICAVLYIVVSLALTGIIDYSELNNAQPMAHALRVNGSNIGSALIAVGAIGGMIAVLLVLMYSQSRIFFVMARDGVLPACFSKLHEKYHTPSLSCVVVTLLVMFIAGFAPIKTMSQLTSIGTLFTFIMATIGVIILRVKRPNLERPFKCPLVFIVAPIAILSCGYLVYTLIFESLGSLMIWLVLSVVSYFLYAYKNSPMKR